MREILFKAKVKDWRELPKEQWWVEGYYFPGYTIGKNIDNVYAFIRDLNGENHWVDPETVCQYKEIIDKAKTKIFDGDICKYENETDEYGIGIICYDYVRWISGNVTETNAVTPLFYLKCSTEWQVIGNIFDNPDLLE